MVTATLTDQGKSSLRAVAPAWHTVVVLLVLLGLSALGARQHGLPSVGRTPSHVPSYLFVMVFEWLLTALIWWGVRQRGMHLTELIGGSWPSIRALLRDVGIAVLYLITANLVLALVGFLLKAAPSQGVRNILPNGPLEISLYLVLCVTAGFCEELIFRGYLQKQFAALTKSAAAGLILQGVMFGTAHGYQGPKYMCIIAVYGCLFGLLAYWRRSLRPGMTAHFLQDSIGGIVGKHFMK